MVQKFTVEILVRHLRIGKDTYKKGEKATFTAEEVKRLGQSVKILAEVPDPKPQKTAAAPAQATTTMSAATPAKAPEKK